MLKCILKASVALVLMTGIAHAGWNLKQEDDGSTVWVNNSTGEKMSIGTPFMTIRVTDVSSEVTEMISIPTTAAVSRIDVAVDGSIRNVSSIFTFWIRREGPVHPRDFQRVSGRGGQVEFNLATSTTTAYHAFITPTGSNIVPAGGIFAVRSDGGAHDDSDSANVVFTITLVPR